MNDDYRVKRLRVIGRLAEIVGDRFFRHLKIRWRVAGSRLLIELWRHRDRLATIPVDWEDKFLTRSDATLMRVFRGNYKEWVESGLVSDVAPVFSLDAARARRRIRQMLAEKTAKPYRDREEAGQMRLF